MRTFAAAPVLLALGLFCAPAHAQSDSDLAQQLSNPVASLISVPLQYNTNSGFDGGTGDQSYINLQPVIPISISPSWNLISRTIVPIIDQNIVPGEGRQTGLGNITQSFFFSPKDTGPGGLIWGAGPVLTIPVATDDLGPDQWGAGFTGVALKQAGSWTVGVLANQVWSVTNNDVYGDTSNAFLQPFVTYTTASALTIALNTESTYDWNADQWAVPINLSVNQLLPVFGQPVQFTAGVRYWADAPDGGPEGWGYRAGITYLFPK